MLQLERLKVLSTLQHPEVRPGIVYPVVKLPCVQQFIQRRNCTSGITGGDLHEDMVHAQAMQRQTVSERPVIGIQQQACKIFRPRLFA